MRFDILMASDLKSLWLHDDAHGMSAMIIAQNTNIKQRAIVPAHSAMTLALLASCVPEHIKSDLMILTKASIISILRVVAERQCVSSIISYFNIPNDDSAILVSEGVPRCPKSGGRSRTQKIENTIGIASGVSWK